MSVIFKLSKYVVLPILIDWLDVKDLTQTDSAVCNHVDRENFLNLLHNEGIKFSGLNDDLLANYYFEWITFRQLKITNLILHPEFQTTRALHKLLPLLSQLKVLVLHNDTHRFNSGFIRILQAAPKLEEIHLSNCHVLDEKSFLAIADNCPLLKKIYFPFETSTWGRFKDGVWERLFNKCKKLEVISIRNLFLSEDVLALIFNANLKEITLCNCNRNKAGKVFFEFPVSRQISSLKVLRLIDCSLQSSETLKKVIEYCPNLTVLDLSLNRRLNLGNSCCIEDFCPKLCELNLSMTGSVNTITIKRILEKCTQLAKLYIFTKICEFLTEHDTTPPLVSLYEAIVNESGSTHLTHLGINFYMTQRCNNASHIKLIKMPTLTVVHSANLVWNELGNIYNVYL
jgi:hypothetical protein